MKEEIINQRKPKDWKNKNEKSGIKKGNVNENSKYSAFSYFTTPNVSMYKHV